MSERLDVRRMLLRRGWTEGRDGMLRKGDALWTVINDCGESGLDGPGTAWTIEFGSSVPARVIVAACEAAAEAPARRPGRKSQVAEMRPAGLSIDRS